MSPASSSSCTASSDITPQQYLDMLHKTRNDLIQLVSEVPASRPSSPRTDKRVESLRDKVQEAYNLARGETADGKWGHLVEMLRLGCTRPRYRRWVVGVRTGAGERNTETDWVSPDTELKFTQWDREWKENVRLKQKVENWKARIDVVPDPDSHPPSVPISLLDAVDDSFSVKAGDSSMGSITKRGTMRFKEGGLLRSSKSSSSLGFPVVKHTSLTALGSKKGKGHSDHPKVVPASRPEEILAQVPDLKDEGRQSDPPNRPPTPSFPSLPPTNIIENASPHPKLYAKVASQPMPSSSSMEISEVSEKVKFAMCKFKFCLLTVMVQLFLPPSFPSQLNTSTPKPGKQIPAREKPPPIEPRPFFSPPSSPKPLRGFDPPELVSLSSSLPLPSATRKRPRPLNSTSDDMNIAFSKQTLLRSPAQPLKKARTMPTIHNGSPLVPRVPNSATSALLGPSTPTRHLPTLTELLASAKKSKSHRSTSRKSNYSTAGGGRSTDSGKRKLREADDSSFTQRPTSNLYISRPTREAPSRVEEPDFTQNPAAFAPDFISSQLSLGATDVHMGGMGSIPPERGSSGFFGTGYNSQLDLEGQIDRVSELLERDVDFDGWLKDIPEVEETGFQDNQANISL